MNPLFQIWLTWILTKALGLCGGGLAAIGLTTSARTPELMAGVVLTAVQMALSWWNTRRALQMPVTLLAAAALLVATLTGCSTTTASAGSTTAASTPALTGSLALEASVPLIRTGAAVATGAVLDFTVKQSSTRTRLANEMYGAASAIYSLSGGSFPTPAQLQTSVLAFGGSQTDASYAQFASSISSLYGIYYPKLVTGDGKTAAALLNALAAGIEDGTAAYVTPPATSLAVAP